MVAHQRPELLPVGRVHGDVALQEGDAEALEQAAHAVFVGLFDAGVSNFFWIFDIVFVGFREFDTLNVNFAKLILSLWIL